MDLRSVEHAGRMARDSGKAQMENPYFTPQNMPKSTGESVIDWQAKIEAWECGWRAGGLSRHSQQISALA